MRVLRAAAAPGHVGPGIRFQWFETRGAHNRDRRLGIDSCGHDRPPPWPPALRERRPAGHLSATTWMSTPLGSVTNRSSPTRLPVPPRHLPDAGPPHAAMRSNSPFPPSTSRVRRAVRSGRRQGPGRAGWVSSRRPCPPVSPPHPRGRRRPMSGRCTTGPAPPRPLRTHRQIHNALHQLRVVPTGPGRRLREQARRCQTRERVHFEAHRGAGCVVAEVGA